MNFGEYAFYNIITANKVNSAILIKKQKQERRREIRVILIFVVLNTYIAILSCVYLISRIHLHIGNPYEIFEALHLKIALASLLQLLREINYEKEIEEARFKVAHRATACLQQ